MTTAYERLRAFVLGTGGEAAGLVVLLRGGVAAWSRVRAAVVDTALTGTEVGPRCECRIEPQRSELVHLLANTICQHLLEKAA